VTPTERLRISATGDISVPGQISAGTFRPIGGSWCIYDTNNVARIGFSNYAGGSGNGESQYNSPYGHQWNANLVQKMYLDVNGNLTASGDITAHSDQRAKENIVTIDSPLDKIMKMRGVYYTRKDIPGSRHIGVIAQEVEEVLPEVVLSDSTENKNKSVAYGNIVALLIEGMKAQQSTIDSLLELVNNN
jgi:hypothetical protein